MNTPSTARIWDAGPQPGRDVDTVRDIDGDLRERWMSDDDEYPDIWSPEADPTFVIGWDELVKELGPRHARGGRMTAVELTFDAWLHDQANHWLPPAGDTQTAATPTCDSCGAIYTPTGAHWDGTNTHIEAMCRASGWGVWAGTTLGGGIFAVVACPTCRRGDR